MKINAGKYSAWYVKISVGFLNAKYIDLREITASPYLYVLAFLKYNIGKQIFYVFFIILFYFRFLPYHFIDVIIFCH